MGNSNQPYGTASNLGLDPSAAQNRFSKFLDLLPGDVVVRKQDIVALLNRLPVDEVTSETAHKFFIELIRQNMYRLVEALPDHDILSAYKNIVSYATQEQFVQTHASEWSRMAGIDGDQSGVIKEANGTPPGEGMPVTSERLKEA